VADRKKANALAANRAAVRAGRVEKPSEHKSAAEIFDEKEPLAEKVAPTAEAPKRDLSDPATQWRILNPETLQYTLDLEDDPRVIEIRTVFTLADEMNRRIYENIESWRSLLVVEMWRFNSDAPPRSAPDGKWISEHTEYLDAAMMRAPVRKLAREIVASLARFVDDDPDRAAQRVTSDHIELGMEQGQLGAAMLLLIQTATRAYEARKKARAAKAAPG
jgi:hypothetical protein